MRCLIRVIDGRVAEDLGIAFLEQFGEVALDFEGVFFAGNDGIDKGRQQLAGRDADGNFPAASHARRLVRCDGHGIPELLAAILPLFPLDGYVEHPVSLMAVMPGDPVETPIWREYHSIVSRYHSVEDPFETIERFAFYERVKQAYAIVSTADTVKSAIRPFPLLRERAYR